MPPQEQMSKGPSEAQPLSSSAWPVVDGSYRLGDPRAPVAVCVLTSDELLTPMAALPGVAIAGEVQTANLGIERIILNITANPSIRFLLLCGKDSRLFRQGQSLGALLENGVDEAGQIIGAAGYEPILRSIPRQQVALFRRQVELVDWSGERDVETLRERVASLAARNPGRFEQQEQESALPGNERLVPASFKSINPGGRREPLLYDPKGYFVITLDRAAGQILLRHYLPDHSPANEMRGRTAESMLLGLLREGLVTQLSHAGYLGGELAKAEAALRLGTRVRYEQDRPLLHEMPPADAGAKAPETPAVPRPMNWEQLRETAVSQRVDVVMTVSARPEDHLLEGMLADPAEEDPMRSFRRTAHPLRVRWSSATRVVMGNPTHFEPGAVLRAQGTLRVEQEVEAELIAVLTKVVTLT